MEGKDKEVILHHIQEVLLELKSMDIWGHSGCQKLGIIL
jgi:hypothetical protein